MGRQHVSPSLNPFFFPLLFPAIDLLYGGIYCFMCQDYIYDKDMEQIAKDEQRKAWKMQGMATITPTALCPREDEH